MAVRLSYYYASRFAEGAKQFEIDLTVNAQDVEETIWAMSVLLVVAVVFGNAFNAFAVDVKAGPI